MSVQANPYNHYLQNQIDSAGQAELLIMLYGGALNFLRKAKDAVAENNNQDSNLFLGKVQDIIAELMGSLDLESGELAANLFNLYEYMYRQLVQANLKKDSACITEVESMLILLKQTWEESQSDVEEPVVFEREKVLLNYEC